MISIKNIALTKINKRYINSKRYLYKKNQNDCIFRFNNNINKLNKT